MNGITSEREKTCEKFAWFEFLLYPALLDKHLSTDSADPNASQLIANFLTNCAPNTSPVETGWASNDVEIVQVNGNATVEVQESGAAIDHKKQLALKLLAIRTAAFLHWDLNLIEKNLPLHMQFMLLNDLQNLLAPESFDPLNCNWKEMSSDLRFATALYHRWIVRTMVNGSFPVRQSRGLSVQIPGQSNPMVTPPDQVATIMKMVFDQHENALKVLKEILVSQLDFRMPVSNSIEMMSESVSDPKHQWDKGLVLNHNDLICQVAYDVGCILFFKKDFAESQKMFKIAAELYPVISKRIYCTLEVDRLNGSCTACSNIVDTLGADLPNQIMTRLKYEINKGSQDAISILINDNQTKELTLSFRDNLQMSISQNANTNADFFAKVVICNALRHASEGKPVVHRFPVQFFKSSTLQDFFCKVSLSTIKSLTLDQKKFMRNFLLLQMASLKELHEKCQDFGIIELLFTVQEEKSLSVIQDKCIVGVPRDLSFTDGTVTKISHLERELISTRTADSVETVLNQLSELTSKSSFLTLNSSWDLPRPLVLLIRNMPSDVNQDLVCILLAKAAELRSARCFEEARSMFKRVVEEAGNLSSHFDTAIRLELMHTDILQFVTEPLATESVKENVLKQSKTCIAAYLDGRDSRDFIPKPELVELSIHILLNCKEWECFTNMPSRKGDLLEFAKLLAIICRDITAEKTSSRNINTDFWEIISHVFLHVTGQYKRSASGVTKERETLNSNYTRVTLRRLIKGIKDSLGLSIILGAITRLHNILKDDKDLDIYLEYAPLWPSVLSNANHFDVPAVSQFLQDILHHCLSVHPTYAPWLKTQGDVVYIQDQFTAALKYYLSAAMVSSDNFSCPLPKLLFDDVQLKRMIQCCCKMQCHTQAAILTQFLDEPNYTLAFKELSERVCSDSCDAYFAHIWDMTLLEFLVNLHARRGEVERQLLVMRLMGQLELNANNNEEIQREAASIRKASFLRAMAKQYM